MIIYTCSDKILCSLGRMYAGGENLRKILMMLLEELGTAEFASKSY